MRSMSWPALTMAVILPPPRWRKMSGASPAFERGLQLAVHVLVLDRLHLDRDAGFSSSNAAIASFQNCWPGPVVEFCHSVISTLPSLLRCREPPPLQPRERHCADDERGGPDKDPVALHVIPVLFFEDAPHAAGCGGRREFRTAHARRATPSGESLVSATNSVSNVFENVFQPVMLSRSWTDDRPSRMSPLRPASPLRPSPRRSTAGTGSRLRRSTGCSRSWRSSATSPASSRAACDHARRA